MLSTSLAFLLPLTAADRALVPADPSPASSLSPLSELAGLTGLTKAERRVGSLTERRGNLLVAGGTELDEPGREPDPDPDSGDEAAEKDWKGREDPGTGPSADLVTLDVFVEGWREERPEAFFFRCPAIVVASSGACAVPPVTAFFPCFGVDLDLLWSDKLAWGSALSVC